MAKLKSCGFLIYRDQPELSFLLMQHRTRWDLPKGHVDKGESDMECALRELHEETGIEEAHIQIDDSFRFDQEYVVSLARYNHKPKNKKLTIFLAKLNDPEFPIVPTEHENFHWFAWSPPHDIQAKTINPVLQAVADHWVNSKILG